MTIPGTTGPRYVGARYRERGDDVAYFNETAKPDCAPALAIIESAGLQSGTSMHRIGRGGLPPHDLTY